MSVREILDGTVGILCEWDQKVTNAKVDEK
jgi:hypothetical protein